jgi:hypothetical protein
MLDDSIVEKANNAYRFYSFDGANAVKNTDTGNVFFITIYTKATPTQKFYLCKIHSNISGDGTFDGQMFSPYLIMVEGKLHEVDSTGDTDLFYGEADYTLNTELLTHLYAPCCNKITNQYIIDEMHEIMNIIISKHFNIVCNVPLKWYE